MQSSFQSIAVIDFLPFWQGDRQSVAAQIDRACREIGFFYLRNHRVPLDLLAQQFEQSSQFFSLPQTAKQQLAWTTAASNRGYGGLGREQLDPDRPSDYKETFNIRRESIEQPNRWPQQLPKFRSTALEFFAACVQTADAVLAAIALALHLPSDFFTLRHSEQAHTLRLLHYPPQSANAIGAAAHTDYGSITLLFQDEVAGLEVQTRSSEWLNVPPIANAVLVNLGDLMQRWTNDEYRSTPHRVRSVAGARNSIAFFCDPNPEVEIACLPVSDRPARYAPITAGNYLLQRLRATY
ncbi:isopenicillin N synthase family oxygenase [Microcoleus sp. FACHB-1515]|uniref:isopenicillin N synthase family dioxygenase n=1 Tax=Cyanophyceae TaxID=3028117 RepID=UPI0016894848|nr:isopenicillin N synthase family oxygenase [Microcoleus sp. FACHB-1515]MBD2092796.1 isopenicillin N synthase family oxygenase [Microcoleus sp. FACHB-1515]